MNCVEELLSGVKSAQVNCKDATGASPVHLASGHGHAQCVALLLAKGAQVDARQGYGQTALHDAAGMGKVEVNVHFGSSDYRDSFKFNFVCVYCRGQKTFISHFCP